MVCLFVARRRRRHVGHHHIGLAAQPLFYLQIRVIFHKVELVNFRARQRFNLLQVNSQHTAHRFTGFFTQGIHARHGDLQPATRCASKINHTGTGHKKAVFIIQFHNLERGTAAKTLGLRAGDVRIVQLTLQPPGRAKLAPAGRLYLDRQIALSAPGCVLFLGHGLALP